LQQSELATLKGQEQQETAKFQQRVKKIVVEHLEEDKQKKKEAVRKRSDGRGKEG